MRDGSVGEAGKGRGRVGYEVVEEERRDYINYTLFLQIFATSVRTVEKR